MAEIKFMKWLVNRTAVRQILSVIVILFFVTSLHPQNTPGNQMAKKKIVLKNADSVLILKDPSTGKDIHHLLGNVHLQDNEIIMWCDSAHFFPDKNQVEAFRKVHIKQGDTLDLYGDYLFYDGKSKLAFVKGNVELIDKETHLYTDSIHYDVQNRIARYTNRGRITNAKNTLTSIIGVLLCIRKSFSFQG